MKKILTLLKSKTSILVETFLKIFSETPRDKMLHFMHGTIISFPLIALFSEIGFAVSIVVFLAKEFVYDKIMKKGTPEINDFIYSAIPAVLFIIMKNL
jgi:hypothetical protein